MSTITANERLSNKAVFEHYNPSIYEIFHENTKLNSYKLKYLQFDLAQSVADVDFKPASLESGKSYPTFQRKPLLPSATLGISLSDALQRRRSVRKYKNEDISYHTLSTFLSSSAGISEVFKKDDNGSRVGFRTYPSAGALYPLEIYILINKVAGVEQGLYHYNVRSNCLEFLFTGNTAHLINQYGIRDQSIKDAGFSVISTAVFKRTTYKYGDRGYRFIMMEVGHVFQNMSLVAEALGLGACEIGGCEDDELNAMLQIDGVNEAVVGEMAVGISSLEEDNSMPDIFGSTTVTQRREA